jgi:hypothetical protein
LTLFRTVRVSLVLLALFTLAGVVHAADAPKPRTGKMPHLEFDLDKKQVRVECEALDTDAPLEFFCCMTGTNEYESVLRSSVTPSNLHTALLAIGLKPGSPVTYSESEKKLIPPSGPPLRISLEYQKDGKLVHCVAQHWLREVKSKQEPPHFGWVFAGSRVMSDGKYAADMTGYIVSVVNFDLTMIDVPELASSANETLEWERNPNVAAKGGTTVWMIIEPMGGGGDNNPPAAPAPPADATPAPVAIAAAGPDVSPATEPTADAPAAAPTTQPSLSDVHIDQAEVDRLQKYWEAKVSPHQAALREAAEAHYKVMADLRREQQRLIDEADRIQRTIDSLEKQYQDMTTPHPEPGS